MPPAAPPGGLGAAQTRKGTDLPLTPFCFPEIEQPEKCPVGTFLRLFDFRKTGGPKENGGIF